MPFLPVLLDEQASPEVRKIYEEVTRHWGFLPNYFQALGHNAQLLQDQVNLFTNAMQEERGSSRSRLPPSSAESTCPAIASHSIWRSWAAWAWTNLSAAGYRSTTSRRRSIQRSWSC